LLGVPVIHLVTSVAVFFFPDDPVRHSMLAYPYLLIVSAYLIFLVWDIGRQAVGKSTHQGLSSSQEVV
jgi:hypothetical protein